MEYSAAEIEKRWQKYWADHNINQVNESQNKPPFYVLDMFPYPSGAGLHVGHPLGYIASDILARYKMLQGFNVLHPMGFDSFGLPAEQYAIQTGQHPRITTEQNINRYKKQLNNIGFSYDWTREIKTSDPEYYQWTQWIFIQLYNSWYNPSLNKADSIQNLIHIFETQGLQHDINPQLTGNIEKTIPSFTSQEWAEFDEQKKQEILMHFRLAYLGEAFVNWCPALGTVLANDEVKDGVSERGGHPVERKRMKQWSLRITAYAERLLQDLEKLQWSESLMEAQKNWIGKSEGCSIFFTVANSFSVIEVFTTRPDTIFGATYITLAPEHDLVLKITPNENKKQVEKYIEETKKRSERERMSDVKSVSGVFTGAYVVHPFTSEKIPVWISDYVLVGYGTGAVMAVPAHDSRDFAFAKTFQLPVKQVIQPNSAHDFSTSSFDEKTGTLIQSDFLNGLSVKQAISKAIEYIQNNKLGNKKVNYKLRDAVFGRQRYWGEPIPVYYKNDIPYPVLEQDLPITLPEIDSYLPTESSEPPLARANNWKYQQKYEFEKTTMPGWAGSSWYFLRYMAPGNTSFNIKSAKNYFEYWKQVDVYIGGAEHATGHLLYVRFWTKFLYDLGYIPLDEPAKKLINQGMILGRSNFVYRIKGTNTFVSDGLKNEHETTSLHVDINIVDGDVLNIEAFKKWRPEFTNAEFILENGKYICGFEVEKMSKSKHNVQTPDELIDKYGADTLRCYEMFLGPLEQSKPWDTKGITGVYGFLKKLWRLFYTDGIFYVSQDSPTKESLKTLHKTIKKITEDLERYSFNTPISTCMIAVNEFTEQKCCNRDVLEQFLIILSPFAPHICEELWHLCGNKDSIFLATWPTFNEKHVTESEYEYPVSFNGKVRFKVHLSLSLSSQEIEQSILAHEQCTKWLEGKNPKKVIVVPNKIVNIVL